MSKLGFVRNLVLFLCFCAELHASADYAIVFVHIGKKVPAYATVAIAQAREFNASASIIMLASNDALASFDCTNIKCISYESLPRSKQHQEFIDKTALDRHSRDGFWLYASERFLYLDELITQFDLKNVFHLEYDNMLYVDLEELLPVFQTRYSGIAATFDNDARCIPGFVYIKNKEAMNRLALFFSDHASKSLNDMEVIALFKNQNSDGICDNLPIISPEYVGQHPLQSAFGHTPSKTDDYVKNIDAFNSIFDAAALGQFLGGIDPRNGDSTPGFINERCLFDPSQLHIAWIPDCRGRKVPHIVYEHGKYRINNLHIHSKKLELFKSKEAS